VALRVVGQVAWLEISVQRLDRVDVQCNTKAKISTLVLSIDHFKALKVEA